MTFGEQVGILLVGSAFTLACQWMLNMYFFHWREQAKADKALAERVEKLELAFVSHTGITINGKSYRTGE